MGKAFWCYYAIVPDAIFKAADEAFGGIEIKELKSLVNLNSLQKATFEFLEFTYTLDKYSHFNLYWDNYLSRLKSFSRESVPFLFEMTITVAWEDLKAEIGIY